MKIHVALPLAFVALSAPSFAADAENGAMLARKCSVCHGKNGIAKDPEVANLAGQSAFYIEKSLNDFRKGIREDRRMSLIVKDLSDDDVKDLAAWFSSFTVTVEVPENAAGTLTTGNVETKTESDSKTSEVKVAAGDNAVGEQLYKKNCRACHGPTGKGLASYPKLIGHPMEYLVDRLERYRAGEKFGPNTPLMAPRAKKLSDEDIVNISNFIVSIE